MGERSGGGGEDDAMGVYVSVVPKSAGKRMGSRDGRYGMKIFDWHMQEENKERAAVFAACMKAMATSTVPRPHLPMRGC